MAMGNLVLDDTCRQALLAQGIDLYIIWAYILCYRVCVCMCVCVCVCVCVCDCNTCHINYIYCTGEAVDRLLECNMLYLTCNVTYYIQ
jgi:hypothetical protein